MSPRKLKNLTDLELFNEMRRRKGNPSLTQEEFGRALNDIRAKRKRPKTPESEDGHSQGFRGKWI